MKVYTKTGDNGTTGLFGGDRVSKDTNRVEAIGTVDELNAHIGLLSDLLDDNGSLIKIQNELFVIGSILACVNEKYEQRLPSISEEDILFLEKSIDNMSDALPPMKYFILPGGHAYISHIHIARAVCRRAERRIIALQERKNETVIKYINRLSDFLFVMSRHYSAEYNVTERPWVPKKN